MASLSDFAENLLAKWLLTATSATRPTTWYLALYTAAPSDSGGGTEVSTGGYARQAITFSVTGDAGTNTNTMTFTASGAGFGAITHGAVFDALSGGNLLCWAAFAASSTIADGQSLALAPGNVTVRFA